MYNLNVIQSIVRRAAFAIAFYLIVSLPLMYFVIGIGYEQNHIQLLADRGAEKISKYVFLNSDLWEFQGFRIEELVRLSQREQETHEQFVTTSDGALVIGTSELLPWLSIEQSADIFLSDTPVGTLTVRASILELLSHTAIVGSFALFVAFLAFAAIYHWPLRLISKTLTKYREEQNSKEKALEVLRATELILAERSDQLIEAQRIGKIGDWSLNVGEKLFYLSPVTRSLLALNGADIEPSLTNLLKRVSDNDGKRLSDIVSRTISTGESASTDIDLILGDGSSARMSVACTAVKAENGKARKLTGTIQDISERREAELQLENLAYFDPLTGLANRAMFKRELAEISGRFKRGEKLAGSILLLDLDYFKEVNDSLGHSAGDELLCNVARRISQAMRGKNFCARLGGDEFAIIIKDTDNPDVVQAYAEQIIDATSHPFLLGNVEVTIGTSIGIASYPTDGTNHETLITNADLALYRAKELGRGRFVIFKTEMSDMATRKMALAHDLREAAKTGKDLQVWFQPQVNASNNQITGFEALMRWWHPKMGFVPPAEFIPIAESSSLISDIGSWILRESAIVAKQWIDDGNPPYEVAVNISVAQIWQGNIKQEVKSVLKETGLPPHLLCLELTESLFANHAEASVRKTLIELKALGVTLALDDFGTGYSSLGYLIQLPFDKLKIDRVFVAGAPESEKMQHVLKGIIALGKGLGMKIVAEGVETTQELSLLRNLGCDQIQGYLFSKPSPRDQIIKKTLNSIKNLKQAA